MNTDQNTQTPLTRPSQSSQCGQVIDPGDRVLLVWDASSMDWALGSIVGGRPTPQRRPRLDAVGRWLITRTAELAAHGGARTASIEPEATVFTSFLPHSADTVRPWLETLRSLGYAVFAKPKIDQTCDLGADMLGHIDLRARQGGLVGLVVASANERTFREPLEALALGGMPVQVLGYREQAAWALASRVLDFIDLADIPGVLREPLPRTGLDSLPAQGTWLGPLRLLSASREQGPATRGTAGRPGLTAPAPSRDIAEAS